MTTFTSISGKQTVEIKTLENGFRAVHKQSFNDGLQMQERTIELKEFTNAKRAESWARKVLA